MNKLFLVCFSFLTLFISTDAALVNMPDKVNIVQAEEEVVNIDSLSNLIGKDVNELIEIYGVPTFIDSLYGASVYYYSDKAIGFGVDVDVITSLLIYQGSLRNEISIGMTKEQVNKILEDDAIYRENNEIIGFTYDGLEGYLQFEENRLVEIFLK